MNKQIEGDLRIDLAVLSNQIIERRGAAAEIQVDPMVRLIDVLANTPGAIEILGELHANGGPIPGSKTEQPEVLARPKV